MLQFAASVTRAILRGYGGEEFGLSNVIQRVHIDLPSPVLCATLTDTKSTSHQCISLLAGHAAEMEILIRAEPSRFLLILISFVKQPSACIDLLDA